MVKFLFLICCEHSRLVICLLISFHVSEEYLGSYKVKIVIIKYSYMYEGESNENCKIEIKIRNIAPLSCKLADMLPML
jgi:hypothetical protein